MFLSNEDISSLGVIGASEGAYHSDDKLLALCSRCRSNPKKRRLAALRSSLKKRGATPLCDVCVLERRAEATSVPRRPRKTWTSEDLETCGLVDTSSRSIKGHDVVVVRCTGCADSTGRKFTDVKDSYRKSGHGYQCSPCAKKTLSNKRGDAWRESLRLAARSGEARERAVANGKTRIKYSPDSISAVIAASGARLVEGDLTTPSNVIRVEWADGTTRTIRIRRFMVAGRLDRPKVGETNPNAVRHHQLLAELGLAIERLGDRRARLTYRGKSWEQAWVNAVDKKCRSMMKKIDVGLRLKELVSKGMSLNKACKEVGVAPVTYYRRLALGIAPEDAALTIRNVEQIIQIEGATYNKTLKKGYRPDILLKKEKLIIEIDGLRWHTEDRVGRSYHSNRWNVYSKAGYAVLVFSEFEVKEKRHIVDSMIAHRLGKTPNRRGARQCELVEMDFTASSAFFDANHLKGAGQGKCLGLKYQGEVIAALRWHKTADGSINISRFANKVGWHIPGAYSRLLSALPKSFEIINFVDRRHGAGEHLASYGFKRVSVHTGFEWTDGYLAFNRRSFLGSTGLEKGLCRYFDYGQVKYVRPAT